MTTKLLHNGHEIWVEPNGKFAAMANREKITASTIATMKKRLDEISPFPAFDAWALVDTWHAGNADIFREVRIVGIKNITRGYNQRRVWHTDRGGCYDKIVRITPETEAARAKFEKMAERHAREIKRIDNEHEAAIGKFVEEAPPEGATP